MAEPTAIGEIDDTDEIRVQLYQSGRAVHAPLQGLVDRAIPDYASKAIMPTIRVRSWVNAVHVLGYAASGDGGDAIYKRVGSEPTHAGKFQSLDGAWWEVASQQLTPQMFGVFSYTGTYAAAADETTRLQNWLDCCVALGRAPYVAIPTTVKHSTVLVYDPTTSTITPRYINMSLLRLQSSACAGIQIGSALRTLQRAYIYPPNVQLAIAPDWSGADGALGLFGGIILYNFLMCYVFLSEINNYTFGVAYEANNGKQWAYNNVYGGNITDCKYNEVLRCISPDTAFCNENNFFGGARRQTSLTNLLGDAYGTYIGAASGAYTGSNNNRWYGTAYEMGAPAGATYRTAVFLDGAGSSNTWHKPRHEGGKGPFGIAKGISSNPFAGSYNEVDMGYTAGASVTAYPWLQVNGALGNIATGGGASESQWHSGPMVNLLSSGGVANAARIKPPFFFMSGTSAAPLRVTTAAAQAITNTKALQVGCGIAIEIDTSLVKSFEISSQSLAGYSGRLFAQALDANGAVLYDTITDAWGTEQYIKMGGVISTAFGGCYQFSSDTPTPKRITVRDEVKKMRIGYCVGTNYLAIESFSIRARAMYAESTTSLVRAIGISLPLGIDNSDQLLATQNPATAGVYGKYSRGDVVLNTNAASAVAEGWQCSESGWLAAAWAISTAYTVPGQVVINDTGKAYELLTVGTSAGAGGPTGTGAATAWAISTAYSVGNYVSQSGNTYICTTAGTSAGSGGPASTASTSRRAAITDNTVTWSFYDGTVPITDNTCTWRYIGVQATFAALPVLP